MRHFFFTLLLVCSTNCLFAKREPVTDLKNFEFLVRGKALGFVFIEDVWARSFSIGTEFRFREQFSFSADIVHFRWRFEYEPYPPPKPFYEYSQCDARNFLILEFRWYPLLRNNGTVAKPFITLFSKIGKRHLETEPGYELNEGDAFTLQSRFYDSGIGLGTQIGGKWGLDVHIGSAYRTEKKSESIFHANADPTYTSNVLDYQWLVNMRLNFYWNFSY
jgi:hypothetical protein